MSEVIRQDHVRCRDQNVRLTKPLERGRLLLRVIVKHVDIQIGRVLRDLIVPLLDERVIYDDQGELERDRMDRRIIPRQ